MLLDDLGTQTMIEVDRSATTPRPTSRLYLRAVDALVAWQAASRPGVLPPYDEALLARELALVPRLVPGSGIAASRSKAPCAKRWIGMFKLIIERNLASPSVYVHRDFMPRNLMMPARSGRAAPGRAGFPGRGARARSPTTSPA